MLPLANRRILITRAKGQASALASQLEALGAIPILIPTIEIAPPEDERPLRKAIAEIHYYDWVIFTSANAVDAFASHKPMEPLPRFAAIGPATAKALEQHGYDVDLVPEKFGPEHLAEELSRFANRRHFLYPRAAVASDRIAETLRLAGGPVDVVEAYRNVIPADSIEQLRTLLTTNPPDAITFTSASTAQNLVALLDAASLQIPAGVVLASIGPLTSTAMGELNIMPTTEAHEATIPALVEALCEALSARPCR